MIYREDKHDFTAPLEAEIARVTKALNTPLATSTDADAILGTLYAERAALNSFTEHLASCVERGTFSHLPGLRTGVTGLGLPHRRYRALDMAPYRGVFLVDTPSATSIGMIFSKAPHDLRARIAALGARWQDRLTQQEGPDR